jgi:hypothetical protein
VNKKASHNLASSTGTLKGECTFVYIGTSFVCPQNVPTIGTPLGTYPFRKSGRTQGVLVQVSRYFSRYFQVNARLLYPARVLSSNNGRIFQSRDHKLESLSNNAADIYIYIYFFLPMAEQPLVDPGLISIEASQSHSDTPHSVGLLWTSDQPDTETYT